MSTPGISVLTCFGTRFGMAQAVNRASNALRQLYPLALTLCLMGADLIPFNVEKTYEKKKIRRQFTFF